MNIINKSAFILSLILLFPACSTMKTTSVSTIKGGNRIVTETTETSFDSKIIDSVSRILMILSGKAVIEASLDAIAAQAQAQIQTKDREKNNIQQKSECDIQKFGHLFKNC